MGDIMNKAGLEDKKDEEKKDEKKEEKKDDDKKEGDKKDWNWFMSSWDIMYLNHCFTYDQLSHYLIKKRSIVEIYAILIYNF